MTNIEARRGDTNRYTTYVTRGGASIDITNASLTFTIKKSKELDDASAITQKSVATGVLDSGTGMVKQAQSGATLGQVVTTIDPEDTQAAYDGAVWYFDVQMIEGSGASRVVTTVDEGRFTVLADVTRATS